MKTKFNPWPLGIVSAFVLFFIGMASVVVIASTHREHLVNGNYYEQELKFQGQIDAAARAKKSGATLVYDAAGGKVVIALPAAQLSEKFSGTVEFYRPSAPELDRESLLEPKADGTQDVNVSKLAAGLWQVRVKWNTGGEDYFLEQKITVAGK
ncbi:MAG: FixH family protein [Verrucomicrobiales bacterium]|nr:FixH family protein [Verrucomicrobiales bacterium]